MARRPSPRDPGRGPRGGSRRESSRGTGRSREESGPQSRRVSRPSARSEKTTGAPGPVPRKSKGRAKEEASRGGAERGNAARGNSERQSRRESPVKATRPSQRAVGRRESGRREDTSPARSRRTSKPPTGPGTGTRVSARASGQSSTRQRKEPPKTERRSQRGAGSSTQRRSVKKKTDRGNVDHGGVERTSRRGSARKPASSSRRESSEEETREISRRSRRDKTSDRSSRGRGTSSSDRGSTRLSRRASQRASSEENRGSRSSRRLQSVQAKPISLKMKLIAAGAVVLLIGGWITYRIVYRAQLMKQMQASSAEDRLEALEKLLKLGGVTGDFMSALKGSGGGPTWPDAARADAAYGLVRLGRGGVDKELSALPGTNDRLTAWVLSAVTRGEAAERFKVDLFLKAATSQTAEVRTAAAAGLGDYRGEEVVRTIITLLHDGDEDVKKAANKALDGAATAEEADQLITLLSDDSEVLREAARLSLIRIADDRVLTRLGSRVGGADSTLALDILGVLGEHARMAEASKAIAASLSHPAAVVRCEALKLIGKRRLTLAYDAAAKAGSDAEAVVRVAALACIGEARSRKHAEMLTTLLADDVADVRAEAILCMAKSGHYTKDVLGQIVALLDDSSPSVKTAAIQALHMIKGTHIKRYGSDPEKWKAWWALYHEQVDIVDAAEAAVKEGNRLSGEQTNESYKKVVTLVKEQIEAIKALRARRDLVPELGPGTRHRARLKTYETELHIMKKWATKSMTL